MLQQKQVEDVARAKQQKRRQNRVNQPLERPILVLVVGDKFATSLDELYEELHGRWASGLEACQICYCAQSARYQGALPVMETLFSQLDADTMQQGCGALLGADKAIATWNNTVRTALDAMAKSPYVAMTNLTVHVICAPENPVSGILADLLAIVYGQCVNRGIVAPKVYLYPLLPETVRSMEEKQATAQFARQLPALTSKEYHEAVLQLFENGPVETVNCPSLVSNVVVLDSVNERHQNYNQYNERLKLVGDLIEQVKLSNQVLLTAGRGDGRIGAEHWLVEALQYLCSENQSEEQASQTARDEICKCITDAVAALCAQGKRVTETCFLCNAANTKACVGKPIDEVEKLLFGNAVAYAYENWKQTVTTDAIVEEGARVVNSINAEPTLRTLADQLEAWAKQQESMIAPENFGNVSLKSEDRTLEQWAKDFLVVLQRKKYDVKLQNETVRLHAASARHLAYLCNQRVTALQQDRGLFEDFVKDVAELYRRMNGQEASENLHAPRWVNGKAVTAQEFFACVVQAKKDDDDHAILEFVANRVALEAEVANAMSAEEIALACRFTVPLGHELSTQTISTGVSSGYVLRLHVMDTACTVEALQHVFIFFNALKA